MNKRKPPTYSTTIVKARPKMNLQNSIIFSLKVLAPEWKTKSLFVKYANNTARQIAIAFAVFSFILKTYVKREKAPIFTIVVNTPKTA